MLCHVVLVRRDVSEERIAYIFRVKKQLTRNTIAEASFYVADYFHFVDVGATFFRNVGSYKSQMASHPRIAHS
jgi:hypothetical protein